MLFGVARRGPGRNRETTDMGWKFYGYACVYEAADLDGDVFTHHCFAEFLRQPNHLAIPMLNAHDKSDVVGRWTRMVEDSYGLKVWGELFQGPVAPNTGLSVSAINAKGPDPRLFPSSAGGKICRSADLAEISLVTDPRQPGARILGESH